MTVDPGSRGWTEHRHRGEVDGSLHVYGNADVDGALNVDGAITTDDPITIQRASGVTNPYSASIELVTPDTTTGQGAWIRTRAPSGWSTMLGTVVGTWWHAFADGVGGVQWGWDGTRLRRADQAGWTALALANGWTNYGSGFGTASYRKTPDGTVWLTGLIANGSLNVTAFTLPAGFRLWLPSDQTAGYQHFPVMTNGGVGIAAVYASGSVWLTSAGTGWWDLSTLHFQAI